MAGNDAPDANIQTPTPTAQHRPFFSRNYSADGQEDGKEEEEAKPPRWGMGILNDPNTHEVPGMARNPRNPPDEKPPMASTS